MEKTIRVTVTIPEKTYYALDLFARLECLFVKDVVQFAIKKTLTQHVLKEIFESNDQEKEDFNKVHYLVTRTWDENKIERIKKLKEIRPDLVTHDEKSLINWWMIHNHH